LRKIANKQRRKRNFVGGGNYFSPNSAVSSQITHRI